MKNLTKLTAVPLLLAGMNAKADLSAFRFSTETNVRITQDDSSVTTAQMAAEVKLSEQLSVAVKAELVKGFRLLADDEDPNQLDDKYKRSIEEAKVIYNGKMNEQAMFTVVFGKQELQIGSNGKPQLADYREDAAYDLETEKYPIGITVGVSPSQLKGILDEISVSFF